MRGQSGRQSGRGGRRKVNPKSVKEKKGTMMREMIREGKNQVACTHVPPLLLFVPYQ
jgi:hypothetical protein